MSTIQELRAKADATMRSIDNSNALGIANLAEKGIELPEDSTTHDVMQSIRDISVGSNWDQVWYEASERFYTGNNLFRGYQGKTIPPTNLITVNGMGYFLGESASGVKSTVEYIDYYLDTKAATSHQYCFRNCNYLEWIVGVNTSKSTKVGGMFLNCSSLTTIQEPLDFSKVTDAGLAFDNCGRIQYIDFVEESIKVSIKISSSFLNPDARQNIVKGLAYITTAQTLTLYHESLLTDEQKAAAVAKGWTLAFVTK